MNRSDYPKQLTFQWVRQQYRSGALTPTELMEEIMKRAEETRDKNIWIVPPAMDLMRPYLEGLEGMDPLTHPLWGLPFAVKDCLDLKGIPTTAACPAYAYTPERSAEVVERLVAAGAVPVGKANLDQFATGLVGVRSPYGETHNALREELISGGSSSGSAVAVALGQSVFSLGTDTAGSGRVPAALNNLVGFKPSYGAWPVRGAVPACPSVECVTVFAHTIEEALEVDKAVRGFDPDNFRSRQMPYDAGQTVKRICVPAETPTFFGPFEKEYQAAWEEALRRVEMLGLPVEKIDISLFEKAAAVLYGGPWIAERWASVGDFVESHADDIFPVTLQILRSGKGDSYSAADLFRTQALLEEYRCQVRELLADAVLMLPTSGGTFTREQVDADPIQTNSQMGLYTNHCNLLSLCAVALPSGWADDRLPFGVTFFAPLGQDGRLGWLASRYARLWEETVDLAVCGLHMQGGPLAHQLAEAGGVYLRRTKTAPVYRLYRLTPPGSPAKPGLVRTGEDGAAIEVEIWRLPAASVGQLLSQTRPPLGFGSIQLEDGGQALGFLCEGYGAKDAEDITSYGGWKAYLTARG